MEEIGETIAKKPEEYTPGELGVDIEAGTVDGEHMGEFGAKWAFATRKRVIDLEQHDYTPRDLGVDLENNTIDGDEIGWFMTRVGFKLRKKNKKHYLNRAPISQRQRESS